MTGFKGFAKPTKIDDTRAEGVLGNVAADEFVMWTGGNYGRRRASGRSACLSVITEKMKPVALATYVKRCLTLADGKGFDSGISVGGLGLHQGAKPAVYLHLVKDADGNFVAKKAIPSPDRNAFPEAYAKGGFKAGDIVMPAEGAKKATTRRARTKKAEAQASA